MQNAARAILHSLRARTRTRHFAFPQGTRAPFCILHFAFPQGAHTHTTQQVTLCQNGKFSKYFPEIIRFRRMFFSHAAFFCGIPPRTRTDGGLHHHPKSYFGQLFENWSFKKILMYSKSAMLCKN
jgi:hypothetical protein